MRPPATSQTGLKGAALRGVSQRKTSAGGVSLTSKKPQTREQTEMVNTKNRLLVARGAVWAAWVMGVRRHEPPVVRLISPGHAMCSTATTVTTTTVLCL